LGPTVLGIASVLQMTLQLSEVVRDAGLTQTFLLEPDAGRERSATYAGLALLSGAVPALAVLALTPALSVFFRQPELLWALPFVALCLVLNSLGTVPNALLLRKAEFRLQGMIGLTAGGITLALTIVLVALGFGFRALVAQLVVGSLLGLVLTLRVQPLTGVRLEWKAIAATFRRARVLLGANLINNVFLLCDIFVIQRLVGAKAAGLYNSAQNIAYKPADLILFPLSRTLMVAFSQSKDDPQKLAKAYYRSLTAIVLLVLPIYAFLASNADGIILVLLGPAFAGGIPVLKVLTLYLAFRTLGNISGNALIPLGRHHWTLWPWVLAIGITGAGVAACSQRPSLMWIVWSFTLGAVAVYSLILTLALVSIRPEKKSLVRVVAALAPLAGTWSLLMLLCTLNVTPQMRLLASCVVFPTAQLAFMGMVFVGSPLAYMTRSGLRELWRSL
jgi:PST family polysaccharide transporter